MTALVKPTSQLWEDLALPEPPPELKGLDVRKGYKVCFWGMDCRHYSAAAPHGEVMYELFEWTTPSFRCGPLAVFTQLKDAKKFYNSLWSATIFRCLYIPEDKIKELYYPREEGYDGSYRVSKSLDKIREEGWTGTKLAKAVLIYKELDGK